MIDSKLRHFVTRERLKIEYLQRLVTGANWSGRIDRLAAGMHILTRMDEFKVVLGSALRWLRNHNRLEERRHYAWMVLAACGWKGMMSGLERKVYVAFQFLRPTRASWLREAAAEAESEPGLGLFLTLELLDFIFAANRAGGTIVDTANLPNQLSGPARCAGRRRSI